ncbi:MAG: N-acetylmuramoyl-L-alanine amidase [Holdemanella sp.]|nr:N-acetylmuramoyl-L-alanine amidase [Holdemanella sp.]
MKRFLEYVCIGILSAIAISFIFFAVQEILFPTYIATVIIDPGHGNMDSGAVGNGNILEKDLCLSLSKKIGDRIKDLDPTIKVLYTRKDDDIDSSDEAKNLQTRIDYGVNQKGDYFLSIHFNSLEDEKVYGYIGYTKEKDEISSSIYSYIASNFERIGWSKNLHLRYVEQTPLQVVSDNPLPSLLLEVGFMTNSHELERCSDEKIQDDIADAIAKAYVKYIQENTVIDE